MSDKRYGVFFLDPPALRHERKKDQSWLKSWLKYLEVRILIWLIVGFLVYTAYQIIKKAMLKPPQKPPEKSSRGEDMAQDPVCGVYIPRCDAIPATANEKVYFFCSTDCREEFLKNNK